MKSLQARAQSVIGWKQAYEEVTSKQLDTALTYYNMERFGAKKVLDTVLVGGELVKAVGKSMLIGIVQKYSEHRFLAQAEREGYPVSGVSAHGLAKKIATEQSNGNGLAHKEVSPRITERLRQALSLDMSVEHIGTTPTTPPSKPIEAERVELPPDSPL